MGIGVIYHINYRSPDVSSLSLECVIDVIKTPHQYRYDKNTVNLPLGFGSLSAACKRCRAFNATLKQPIEHSITMVVFGLDSKKEMLLATNNKKAEVCDDWGLPGI